MAIGFFSSKKAITPIIAVILLLMMTVAAAGAAFYWLSRIQGQMQGGTESYQGQMFERMAGQVEVVASQYLNTTHENLTIILKNTGNVKIPLFNVTTFPTTTWILRDPKQGVVCSTDWASSVNCTAGCSASTYLDISESKKIVLSLLSSSCSIASSSYGTGSLYSFTIDFSGKATATGSFMK
jgi:flagellin-like protein